MAVTALEGVGLVIVGAIASGINAVAGGGSLLSYPYLNVFMGIPAIPANATNSVGLWPGSLTGGLGFLKRFGKTRKYLPAMIPPTILGSIAGAILLLNTTDKAFRQAIPFLILLAAVLLLLQPKVKKLVGHRALPVWVAPVLQFLVALYGGFFGAGMGIMMLACFALTMEGDIHEINAVKNWLGLIINFVCSGVFIYQGGSSLVRPLEGGLLIFGGLIGGYLAAHASQRFDPDKLRNAIAVYGVGMAAYFMWRAFGVG
ncbi:sulfite exporter TauE/SafE family protein [bacterium]|nr:MAG: sulfite exporter TauE/SafE family protein [bacterium]